VECSCEQDNEPSGYIKCSETRELLCNWWLLKKDSAPWNLLDRSRVHFPFLVFQETIYQNISPPKFCLHFMYSGPIIPIRVHNLNNNKLLAYPTKFFIKYHQINSKIFHRPKYFFLEHFILKQYNLINITSPKSGVTCYKSIFKTLWPVSTSELYQPSDRRLSAKLVPTFVNRGCHVVSVTDSYSCILNFLDQNHYFFFQVAPQLYSRC
jgi:hypothetical protein